MTTSSSSPFEGPQDKPNWVSSRTKSKSHLMLALKYKDQPQQAMARLKLIIESMSGSKIISSDDQSYTVEYTTRILRFVDDLYFEINADLNVIDFISKSRIGYSDLGANRSRIEQVRDLFESK